MVDDLFQLTEAFQERARSLLVFQHEEDRTPAKVELELGLTG